MTGIDKGGFEFEEYTEEVNLENNAYKTLGLPIYSDVKEIKRKFVELMKIVYPDSNSLKISIERFTDLTNAYQKLSSRKKENYDLSLKIQDKDINLLIKGKKHAFFHRGNNRDLLTIKADSSLELRLIENGVNLMRYRPSKEEALKSYSI